MDVGFTTVEPISVVVEKFPGMMFTDDAFATSHESVTLAPALDDVGFAENDVIVGSDGPPPPELDAALNAMSDAVSDPLPELHVGFTEAAVPWITYPTALPIVCPELYAAAADDVNGDVTVYGEAPFVPNPATTTSLSAFGVNGPTASDTLEPLLLLVATASKGSVLVAVPEK